MVMRTYAAGLGSAAYDVAGGLGVGGGAPAGMVKGPASAAGPLLPATPERVRDAPARHMTQHQALTATVGAGPA